MGNFQHCQNLFENLIINVLIFSRKAESIYSMFCPTVFSLIFFFVLHYAMINIWYINLELHFLLLHYDRSLDEKLVSQRI